MTTERWLSLLIWTLSVQVSVPPEATDKPTAPSETQSTAEALKTLELPPSESRAPNGPPGPTKANLFYQYLANCREAMDLLARTESAVDAELVRLAESTKPLHVRYRAVSILASRQNVAVIGILEKMCESDDVNERYLGWNTYQRAVGTAKKLRPPSDITPHLARYEKESDEEVRESMEWFFGTAKAKTAVKPLLSAIDRHPGWAMAAVWSLGEIGDKSAVPAIIKDFPKSSNRHYHLQALGKLATPESVDFIIDHLGEWMAVDVLYRTGSPKALPALERHLEKLQQRKDSDYESDIAATRIAIIRLSQTDCREALVKIAEDPHENQRARWDAFDALREYDTKKYTRRILEVYKTDSDSSIKRICIWLLAGSKEEGITEAMIDHALQAPPPESKSDLATDYALLEALNKHLGTFFGDLEKLRLHLRKLKK